MAKLRDKYRWIWRSYRMLAKKEITMEEFKIDMKLIQVGLEPPREDP